MNRMLTLSILLLLSVMQAPLTWAQKPDKGELDLRNYDFKAGKLITLKGEWNFYWNKFIAPSLETKEEAETIIMPNEWNQAANGKKSYSPYGYASYHLRLLLPERPVDLALKIYSFSSAYSAYANGKFIGQVGDPGTSAENSIPAFGPKILNLYGVKGQVDLVFHVSNYKRDKAGIWESPKLGIAQKIHKKHEREVFSETFLIATIIVLAFYQLMLYFQRKKASSNLFLSIFAFLIAFRVMATGEYLLYHIVPLEWLTTFRLEYFTFYAALPVFALYVQRLFANRFWKPASRIIIGIALISIGILLFTPTHIFIETTLWYQLITVAFSLYVIYLLFEGVRRKERSSAILLAGFFLFFLTVVNDILFLSGHIQTTSMLSVGIVIFLFSQAYLLSWRAAVAFQEAEQLSNELNHVNKNLEQLVGQRTEEIRSQNEEIRVQNEEISRKNEELESQREEIQSIAESIQDANDAVNQTNEELAKKNKALTQSIQYAERIQSAVFPRNISRCFTDHFVLFKPRDIVSGDFYWIRRIRSKTIAIVADCTGHGVPGAFMSLLGMTFLNEIVHQQITPDAKMILEIQRKKVKETLNQGTGHVRMRRDGMDMGIIIVDREKEEINYAGAYLPLLRISDGALTKFKPDRMPVAIHHKERSFTQHFIPYKTGDSFYLFTDGYTDQIGGGKREKFKLSRFQNLLLDNQSLPMEEQKKVLVETLEAWKGDYPVQVDDILIFGARF